VETGVAINTLVCLVTPPAVGFADPVVDQSELSEADSIDCRWSRAEGLSVGYWPLAINIMTHSGVRSWTGSLSLRGVTVDG